MNDNDLRRYLLPRALEEELKNWKVRAWGTLYLTMAGGVFGFFILLFHVSKLIYPLTFLEARWFMEWGMPVPTAILMVIGGMALVMSKDNGTMPLYANERALVDGSPRVWDNLPAYGQVLLVISGVLCALGITAFFLAMVVKFAF